MMKISRYREFFSTSKTWHAMSLLVCGLCTMLFAFGASSCSDKDISEPDSDKSPSWFVDGDLTMCLDITLPNTNSTRSTTENTGGSSGDKDKDHKTEQGTDNEGMLGSAIIYFFDSTDDTFITYIDEFEEESYSGANLGSKTTLKATIKPSKLKDLCGKIVKVFIAGNVSPDLDTQPAVKAKFSATSVDGTPLGVFQYSEAGARLGNLIPLANNQENTIDFSELKGETDGEILASLAALFEGNGYSSIDRNLNLSELKDGESVLVGSILLERCVAKVDFQPNHVLKSGTIYYPDNVYPVGEIPNLFAKMTSIQIFNVSKNGFLFRHTAPGNNTLGTTTTITEGFTGGLFGFEKGLAYGTVTSTTNNPDGSVTNTYNDTYNWIVDTDWYEKQTFTTASSGQSWTGPFDNGTAYFLNQPTKVTNPASLTNYYTLSVDASKTDAQNGVLDLSDKTQGTWYSWCYISENTLPSTAAMIKGLSTGIAFRTVVCKEDGTPLSTQELSSKFISQSVYNSNNSAYDEAYQEWVENDKEGEEPVNANEGKIVGAIVSVNDNYLKMTVGASETILKKVTVQVVSNPEDVADGGNPVYENKEAWEMTYYYFFRHNVSKDHLLGTVEPMQFAVVRNNIYKISVTSLNGLPEPYDPGDPDEPQKNVISVECNILSWARVDNDDVKL